MNIKVALIVLLMICSRAGIAHELKTARTVLKIDEKGHYTSIMVDGKEILTTGTYPIISALKDGKVVVPKSLKVKGAVFYISMEDGQEIEMKTGQHPQAITYEISKIGASYNAIVFGPVKVSMNDVVGEVVGVVQHGTIAFAMQSLHIKTNAGIPEEYAERYSKLFNYTGKNTNLSVSSVPYYNFAAVDVDDGAVFQLSCKNRTQTELRKVQGLEQALTLSVKGTDAGIAGAKIAIFGDRRDEILNRIGKVELEQGLPHPTIEGQWDKVSRAAMRAYLITNFSAHNFEFALDKVKKAGFKNLYHPDPFKTWGHFNWNPGITGNEDAGVKTLVDVAGKRGVQLGIHTLSNFTTTNDLYVTPVPSKNLLKQGELKLVSDINDTQTEIDIFTSDLFSVPLTLNALQLEDELITFGKAEKKGEKMTLTGCVRGAFGTRKAAHGKTKAFYKLWDYPYKTLFPDLELQDAFARRLADVFNKTGIRQISFDGLEGCMYTGQDYYATAKFVTEFYRNLQDKTDIINDASRLDHYLWHIHTRMNWGEPWGEEMRKGQVENRIKNQEYFRRNLFPRMLGWFLVRLSERKFEATSLEDLEWALSESAGFDAGYAMSINMKTLQNHGQIDLLLDAMKNWDALRLANAFTEEQKSRLKNPETEWHLEKVDDKQFLLYPLYISKRFTCDLSEMQPGQPGGADWVWYSPEESAYALRIKMEGDGSIANPSFKTDKGVLKIEGKLEKGQYILLDHKGNATLTDENYKVISPLTIQGMPLLPKGNSAIAFSCDVDKESRPEVTVRYITRSKPEMVAMPK